MLNNVLDFEIIKECEQLWYRPIIVYGTSSKAEKLFSLINNSGINVVAYCDGDEKKVGNLFHGNRIEKLTEVALREDISSSIILICSSFVDEIICDCIRFVEDIYGFLTAFGFQHAILLNRFNLRGSFRDWYIREYDMWKFLNRQKYKNSIRAQYIANLIKFQETDSVLVYQAGKVGSAGISDALNDIHKSNIHIHYLNPYYNYFSEEESNVYISMLNKIVKNKKKIKIITLVREPIARDISGAFQSIADPSRWMYRNMNSDIEKSIINIMYESFINVKSGAKKESYEEKINAQIKGNIGFLFNWYNVEMKNIFGIDIYSVPFNKEKGYTIIKKNNIECLVLKLEKMNTNQNIIAQFVSNDNICINHNNSAEKKPYRFIYNEFINRVKVPSDIIEFYYNSPYMKHFYTDIEISNFRKKWKL